jgi:hypothetical protein
LAVPFRNPQLVLVVAGVMVMAVGCVTVTDLILLPALASVTVTEYAPAVKPVIEAVVLPLLQL